MQEPKGPPPFHLPIISTCYLVVIPIIMSDNKEMTVTNPSHASFYLAVTVLN